MGQLDSITINNFRSIRGTITVPLDAPVVLVHGQNGAGKTSLLSAIELGLTGQVPSLSRVDKNYQDHLLHKDELVNSGFVSLSMSGLDKEMKQGNIQLTSSTLSGDSLLNSDSARFYSERCYLAQSTLSRLLELYEHKDTRKADSPLTKFVKDLLGLDHLDALIDGLHDSGDVRRVRSSVTLYGEVRERIPVLEKEIIEKRKYLESVANSQREESWKLDEIMSLLELEESLSADLPNLLQTVKDESDEHEMQTLANKGREAQAIRLQWRSIGESASKEERAEAETHVASSNTKLQEWQIAKGQSIEQMLDVVTESCPGIPSSSDVGMKEAVASAIERLGSEVERCTKQLKVAAEDEVKLSDIDRSIEDFNYRGRAIDKQMAEQTVDADQVARALSQMLPHTHSDDCPVCGRDFGEVSSVPLRDHLSFQIEKLSASAQNLRTLADEKASVEKAKAEAERERSLILSRSLKAGAREKLFEREKVLRKLFEQLKAQGPAVDEGQLLLAEARKASQALGSIESNGSLASSLRESVDRLLQSLSIKGLDRSESLPGALDRLDDYIGRRKEYLDNRVALRRKGVASVEKAMELGEQCKSIRSSISAIELKLNALTECREAADAIINDARDLSRRAKKTRTQIVRRVFNNSLNNLWADLFTRLAPEELFVPAFAVPKSSSGPVEAVLETHHKSGSKGGNPRAMLSAGNLNTAALTLFLALHLSAPRKLPWLVIDDPVQSMDEVHISQFAALLRTLSKSHNRQIVIAVHEKALFDYLSLELSPAFSGDQLITVELGKDGAGHTSVELNRIDWKPDAAFAA